MHQCVPVVQSFQQSLGKDENGISSAGCGVVCIAKHAQFDFYSGEIELLLPLNNKVCVLPVLKSEGKRNPMENSNIFFEKLIRLTQ